MATISPKKGHVDEDGLLSIINKPAKGISYFTPAQEPPAGTAIDPQPDGAKIPKLFQPLKIRGLTLQNRIMLSPLCQYSAQDGHHTMWHWTHLGGIIQRGPGLTMVEATSVTPEGRITPEDSGLWKDSQIEPLRKTVEFAHSQGQKIGIQLGHAGRKASTLAPWFRSARAVALKEENGWPDEVIGPSALKWNTTYAPVKEMTKEDIESFKAAYLKSVNRALEAGFDVIEIHAAHGYLLSSFLSPAANQRTDEYGGSFENRTRLVKEVVTLVRAAIPEDMPLFLRISGSDWLEETDEVEGWTSDDTAAFAPQLAELGVDLLDVSSGGNHPKQHPHVEPSYQAPFAKAAKAKVGDKLLVATVGAITSGKQAQGLLDDGLDLIVAGRAFQKNPGLVWAWADELDVQIHHANQIGWGFVGPTKPKDYLKT